MVGDQTPKKKKKEEERRLIACLGWGSLVWDPRELPVRGKWFRDGPFLPIEFARESDDGRMTLVFVSDTFPLVRSLWALMSTTNLARAREALRSREGVLKKNAERHIAHWSGGKVESPVVRRIAEWSKGLKIGTVIWTNLPPKFHKDERVPSVDEVVAHLDSLPHEKRKNAERYVRMTPRQIDTNYRRIIQARLGWTPIGEI